MKPIRFEGQTVELQKPPGMTDEECGSLPILRLDGTCISCWQMTWKERLKALLTGRVWLGVLSGHTQPPVYVTVEQPFTIQKATPEDRKRLRQMINAPGFKAMAQWIDRALKGKPE
jgi:hypothetical protein